MYDAVHMAIINKESALHMYIRYTYVNAYIYSHAVYCQNIGRKHLSVYKSPYQIPRLIPNGAGEVSDKC